MISTEQLVRIGREEAKFCVEENFRGAGGFFAPWSREAIERGLQGRARELAEEPSEVEPIFRGMKEVLDSWEECPT